MGGWGAGVWLAEDEEEEEEEDDDDERWEEEWDEGEAWEAMENAGVARPQRAAPRYGRDLGWCKPASASDGPNKDDYAQDGYGAWDEEWGGYEWGGDEWGGDRLEDDKGTGYILDEESGWGHGGRSTPARLQPRHAGGARLSSLNCAHAAAHAAAHATAHEVDADWHAPLQEEAARRLDALDSSLSPRYADDGRRASQGDAGRACPSRLPPLRGARPLQRHTYIHECAHAYTNAHICTYACMHTGARHYQRRTIFGALPEQCAAAHAAAHPRNHAKFQCRRGDTLLHFGPREPSGERRAVAESEGRGMRPDLRRVPRHGYSRWDFNPGLAYVLSSSLSSILSLTFPMFDPHCGKSTLGPLSG